MGLCKQSNFNPLSVETCADAGFFQSFVMVPKIFLFLLLIPSLGFAAALITGKVVEVAADEGALMLKIHSSEEGSFARGETEAFRVSAGDLEIDYMNRVIRGHAMHYNKRWHLEQIFPLTGEGSAEVFRANEALKEATKGLKRSQYLREGDVIPEFGMIDQDGAFFRMGQLSGKAFVINFIFTRCAAPKMCPAASARMAAMQDEARKLGMKDLEFVTVTFDPTFDSPAVLRNYAEGYGIELSNFHLLTGSSELINDLLHRFGILKLEEDGTINHTMATLLVDQDGRVAYRKEGKYWTVDEFLKEAQKLQ